VDPPVAVAANDEQGGTSSYGNEDPPSQPARHRTQRRGRRLAKCRRHDLGELAFAPDLLRRDRGHGFAGDRRFPHRRGHRLRQQRTTRT
jgi:hypothetical protein